MKNIKTLALMAALTLIASGFAQAETTTFTSNA